MACLTASPGRIAAGRRSRLARGAASSSFVDDAELVDVSRLGRIAFGWTFAEKPRRIAMRVPNSNAEPRHAVRATELRTYSSSSSIASLARRWRAIPYLALRSSSA